MDDLFRNISMNDWLELGISIESIGNIIELVRELRFEEASPEEGREQYFRALLEAVLVMAETTKERLATVLDNIDSEHAERVKARGADTAA